MRAPSSPPVNVHAWDSKDVSRWLRGGGAMQIQTELNRNTARYSWQGAGQLNGIR